MVLSQVLFLSIINDVTFATLLRKRDAQIRLRQTARIT
jgi:hypothetical protein